MLTASYRVLYILAALVWCIGGIVLMIKGCSQLLEAELLQPDQHWPWTAAIIALLIGSIKATFLFSKSCRKNLAENCRSGSTENLAVFQACFLFIFIADDSDRCNFIVSCPGKLPFLAWRCRVGSYHCHRVAWQQLCILEGLGIRPMSNLQYSNPACPSRLGSSSTSHICRYMATGAG